MFIFVLHEVTCYDDSYPCRIQILIVVTAVSASDDWHLFYTSHLHYSESNLKS